MLRNGAAVVRGECFEDRGGATENDEALKVAGGEGVGGVGEDGDDRGGAVVIGGELLGSEAADTGCAQRQRVLADQELETAGSQYQAA